MLSGSARSASATGFDGSSARGAPVRSTEGTVSCFSHPNSENSASSNVSSSMTGVAPW